MHFSPAVALLVALTPSCLFAMPTRTTNAKTSFHQKDEASEQYESTVTSSIWATAGKCDLSSVTMPLDEASSPSPLPSPSSGLVLSHVAVGRGTQNYTCSGQDPTATPKALGAVATLFNATCEAVTSPDLLYKTPSIALNYDVPTASSALAAYNMLLSGHHYFTNTTTPFFNLDTDQHTYGVIAGKKASSANAPSDAVVGKNNEGYGAVPWLQLTALNEDGFAFKEVYRLNTAGGQAPSTCENETGDFQVEYAATYWFWTLPGTDAYGNSS